MSAADSVYLVHSQFVVWYVMVTPISMSSHPARGERERAEPLNMAYAAANASVNTPRNPVVPYSRRLGLRVNLEARALWATDCGGLSGAGICLALAEVSSILLNDYQPTTHAGV